MSLNTSEFLNYLITNYTSCYIYTEVGTAVLRVKRATFVREQVVDPQIWIAV